MSEQIKDQITQLAEMSRALVQDLDISHKIVAECRAERDALSNEVEELKAEILRLLSPGAPGANESNSGVEALRLELAQAHDELVELSRECQSISRSFEKEHLRAELAEKNLNLVIDDYIALEEERDHLAQQFQELDEAMKDIRHNLLSYVGDEATAESCLA